MTDKVTWDHTARHYLRAIRFYISLRKIGYTSEQTLGCVNHRVGLFELDVTMKPSYQLFHLKLQDVLTRVEGVKNSCTTWEVIIIQMDQKIVEWAATVFTQCCQLIQLDLLAPLEAVCDKLEEDGYQEESLILKDWQIYYEPPYHRKGVLSHDT